MRSAGQPEENGRFIAITLRARLDDETGQYESQCEELGVASCGDDLDQAFENVLDAVLVYLRSIEASGELERIFAERGITVHAHGSEAPRSIQARPDEYVSPHLVSVAV